jgi:hypothetical protein
MPDQYVDKLAGLGVPYSDTVIAAAAGEESTGRTQGQRWNLFSVRAPAFLDRAILCVPFDDVPVVTGAEEWSLFGLKTTAWTSLPWPRNVLVGFDRSVI